MVRSRRGLTRSHGRTASGRPRAWHVVLVSTAVVVALANAAQAGTSSPTSVQSRACRSCVAQGVSATSTKLSWIVGFRGGPGSQLTWIRQWNGRHWHNLISPNPGTSNELFGVDGESQTDAWAVGWYFEAHAAKNLLEHWDGTSWTWVPGPLSVSSPLVDVATVSPTDAWAVGNYVSNVGQRSLIEHWNGTSWTQIASPNPSGATSITLSKVTATSATDAWALGSYHQNLAGKVADNGLRSFVLHWDGTSWTQVQTVTQNLQDISSDGATDAWAVGAQNGQTVTEHWDGGQWTRVASPNPGQGFAHVLQAVDARATNDVWAAGFDDDQGTDNALILHWDGTSWTDAHAAMPTDSYIYGISADSPTDAWAIGTAAGNGAQHALLEHWDGTTWSEA